MPIEFSCTQCGRLLRTADETAGRSARCPACGTVMTVPDRAEPPAADQPFAEGGEIPFGVASPVDEPGEPVNPYRAPADHMPFSPSPPTVAAIERVRAPAICLIVMAALGLAACLGIALLYAVLLVAMMNDRHFAAGRPEDALVGFGIMIGYGLLGAGLSTLMLVGGVKMKNLRSYGLAMTAAILMVIPCFSPCGILGMPFGIWALIVLTNAEVTAAFR